MILSLFITICFLWVWNIQVFCRWLMLIFGLCRASEVLLLLIVRIAFPLYYGSNIGSKFIINFLLQFQLKLSKSVTDLYNMTYIQPKYNILCILLLLKDKISQICLLIQTPKNIRKRDVGRSAYIPILLVVRIYHTLVVFLTYEIHLYSNCLINKFTIMDTI